MPSSATEGAYTSTFEVTGGTGKFKRATGSFEMPNGRCDEEAATHNAAGTISYYVKKRHRGHGPDHHDDDDCDDY